MSKDQLTRRRKCFTNEQHLRRDVDEILTANDMSDALVCIVDGVGQMKHRRAVRTKDDEIFKNGVFETDGAANEIVECRNSGVGNTESNNVTIARTQCAVSTESVVARCAAAGLGTSLYFVGGARTPVGRTVAEEFLDSCEMHGPTLGLMNRRAVPIEPQPLEGAEDDVDQFGARPLGVGVFDTQNELAALLAGKEPVEKGGSCPTDVEIARRRRGEADSGDWGVHRVDGTVRPSLSWLSHRFREDFRPGPPSLSSPGAPHDVFAPLAPPPPFGRSYDFFRIGSGRSVVLKRQEVIV
ncbi:unannotated protein [freshwater metagenome]|uniref:Unannotated protein n=1 Tax=freshwater metagenome TaxID=449393 RepID=A0A6J6EI68_9ZZZZ